MESIHQKSVDVVTSVFATPADAEQAYQTLLNLGYRAGEIALVMSEETFSALTGQAISMYAGSLRNNHLQVTSIPEALEAFGRYVSLPGLALVVAYQNQVEGARALSGSVLSDQYGGYFQKRIHDGEILIDFGLHTGREKRLVTDAWGHFGGYPLIRRMKVAA